MPLLTDPEAGDRNLRLLLMSMCLRRTRVLLDIPEAENQTVTLSLSTEERSIYSQVIEDARRKIDDCISSTSITKAYNGIFQAILRLRLLCNNGTLHLPSSGSEIQGECVEEEYVVGRKKACTFCSFEIILSDAQEYISPIASPCDSPLLLCPACLSPNDVDKTVPDKKLRKQQPRSIRRVQRMNHNEDSCLWHDSGDRVTSRSLYQSVLSDGHSSKLSALVSNIQRYISASKRYVDPTQLPDCVGHY